MHEQAQLRARAIKGPADVGEPGRVAANSVGRAVPLQLRIVQDYVYGRPRRLELRRGVRFPCPWIVVRPPGAVTGILLARADGETQVASVGQQMAGRVGFFLRVEDFDAAHRRMIAAGVTFVTPPDETRGQPCGHRNSPSLHLASLTVGRRAGISSLLGLFVSLDPPPWCSVASDATVPTRRRPPS